MERFYEVLGEIFGNKKESGNSNAFIVLSQIFIGIIILTQNIQMF